MAETRLDEVLGSMQYACYIMEIVQLEMGENPPEKMTLEKLIGKISKEWVEADGSRYA